MGEKIDINQQVLTDEITNLQELLTDIKSNTVITEELVGKGYTKEYMSIVNSSFIGLKNTLEFLIDNTITLLKNISDGYIDIDEIIVSEIEEFINEVIE